MKTFSVHLTFPNQKYCVNSQIQRGTLSKAFFSHSNGLYPKFLPICCIISPLKFIQPWNKITLLFLLTKIISNIYFSINIPECVI